MPAKEEKKVLLEKLEVKPENVVVSRVKPSDPIGKPKEKFEKPISKPETEQFYLPEPIIKVEPEPEIKPGLSSVARARIFGS